MMKRTDGTRLRVGGITASVLIGFALSTTGASAFSPAPAPSSDGDTPARLCDATGASSGDDETPRSSGHDTAEPVRIEANMTCASELRDALSPAARETIAPVLMAIAQERARQAALPASASPREQLERMGRMDQAARSQLTRVRMDGLSEPERTAAREALWATIGELDAQLLSELLPLVPAQGWFSVSAYGQEAARAAFFIIQHADADQWRRFVPLLEPLVGTGEVNGQDYGMMYDRLALHENRPQRYGTQLTCSGGVLKVDRALLEDPAKVDERRQAVGFSDTLVAYEASVAEFPC